MTLATAVDDLVRRGFREDFRVVDGKLRALGSGETLGAEDVMIREFHRFEGVSDPDDMAIVYGVESASGLRGTLVDAFGVYADPGMGAFLEGVPFRKAAPSAARQRWVTDASRIDDVLAQYPSTAPVFINSGRLYVDRPGSLYATFAGLSVGEYATRNGLDRVALLDELNALAESDEAARRRGQPTPTADAGALGDFSVALGYTGAYRAREDAVPEQVSVVAVQAARGPE